MKYIIVSYLISGGGRYFGADFRYVFKSVQQETAVIYAGFQIISIFRNNL